MKKLRVLDLFSGIGGFSLGLERTGGFETVAFCEIDPFCRKVLAKHWPNVRQYEDVRQLRGDHVGTVDVICGGYPCQPFSVAGRRQGAEDDRHLWPEMRRLVDELRPTWVVGENVAGHISMGLDNVLSDLEERQYAVRAFVVPACAVNAPHRRDRVWIVAHTERERPEDGSASEISESAVSHQLRNSSRDAGGRAQFQLRVGGSSALMADADCQGLERRSVDWVCSGEWPAGEGVRSVPGKWLPEPAVGRVAHGVPNRVDRLRSLGNAVVPQIPELIGRAILAAEAA